MPQYTCPSCKKIADAPEENARTIVACLQCGCCLQAPLLTSNYRKATNQAVNAPTLATLSAGARPQQQYTMTMVLGCLLPGILGGAVMIDGLDFQFRMLALVGAVLTLLTTGGLFVAVAQRNRPVRPALLVPLPEVLPQEAERLGPPTAVFHTMTSGHAFIFVLIGLVFGVAGAVGIVAVAQGQFGGQMPKLAVVCTIAAVAATTHGLRCLWSRYHVLICPEGFVRLSGDRAEVCRWDEIDTFEEKVEAQRKDQLWTVYRLRRTDGVPFVFKGNHLENTRKFGQILRQEILRWRLPDLVQQLNKGGTVVFGRLQVGPAGVANGLRTLSWDEIAGIEVNKERLTILSRGNPHRWCKIKIADIPNALLFPALLQTRNVPVQGFATAM
jgi:hypothetical protein